MRSVRVRGLVSRVSSPTRAEIYQNIQDAHRNCLSTQLTPIYPTRSKYLQLFKAMLSIPAERWADPDYLSAVTKLDEIREKMIWHHKAEMVLPHLPQAVLLLIVSLLSIAAELLWYLLKNVWSPWSQPQPSEDGVLSCDDTMAINTSYCMRHIDSALTETAVSYTLLGAIPAFFCKMIEQAIFCIGQGDVFYRKSLPYIRSNDPFNISYNVWYCLDKRDYAMLVTGLGLLLYLTASNILHINPDQASLSDALKRQEAQIIALTMCMGAMLAYALPTTCMLLYKAGQGATRKLCGMTATHSRLMSHPNPSPAVIEETPLLAAAVQELPPPSYPGATRAAPAEPAPMPPSLQRGPM